MNWVRSAKCIGKIFFLEIFSIRCPFSCTCSNLNMIGKVVLTSKYTLSVDVSNLKDRIMLNCYMSKTNLERQSNLLVAVGRKSSLSRLKRKFCCFHQQCAFIYGSWFPENYQLLQGKELTQILWAIISFLGGYKNVIQINQIATVSSD